MMNSFLDLAKSRYSVRNYLEKPVEEEKLQYILECGRIAPSAANYQPWHVIVIRDKEMLKRLALTYNRTWFIQAPVVLVICGDHNAALCKQTLLLPGNIEPIAYLPVGYPSVVADDTSRHLKRKSLKEIIHYESF